MPHEYDWDTGVNEFQQNQQIHELYWFYYRVSWIDFAKARQCLFHNNHNIVAEVATNYNDLIGP